MGSTATNRKRCVERPICTWEEMKIIIHQRLQSQGSKRVDEYYKKIEMAIIRANVAEDCEATMAKFLAGLNQEIREVIELQQYVEIDDLVQRLRR